MQTTSYPAAHIEARLLARQVLEDFFTRLAAAWRDMAERETLEVLDRGQA